MKTEFQVKFLGFLIQTKKESQGFTLIELLVVIVIVGILAAIALPSFLGQATKAKQSEAKRSIGAMNRAQQAYYLETTSFTSTIDELGLGLQTQTVNYSYQATIDTTNGAVNHLGSSLKVGLKHYSGRVYLSTLTATSEATTMTILCESIKPQRTRKTNAAAQRNGACTRNYKVLSTR